jgi:hypothetical protein
MKVELNIDAGNIGETVIEMFKNLTTEQKEAVSLKVLQDWLTEPDTIHRQALHVQAMAFVRERGYGRNDTEQEIMAGRGYKEFVTAHPTAKTRMVEEITSATIAHQKTVIEQIIKTDPEMNRIMSATLETIKENFPKIVNDAMIAWFCGNMSTMANAVQQTMMQSQSTQEVVRQIQARLG